MRRGAVRMKRTMMMRTRIVTENEDLGGSLVVATWEEKSSRKRASPGDVGWSSPVPVL
jgi:hypothetical protein